MTGRDAADLRGELGITIESFARLVGVSLATANRWEADEGSLLVQGSTGEVLASIRGALVAGGEAEMRVRKAALDAAEGRSGLGRELEKHWRGEL